MSHKRRTTLEKSIQRDIEEALGAEPDLLLLRNSVGQAQYFDDDGKAFYVPYGLGNGSPDLVGLLRVRVLADAEGYQDGRDVGIWFCLEVKPPEGELEDDQKKCHAIWRRFGAFVETVRSVQDAKRALERARRLES